MYNKQMYENFFIGLEPYRNSKIYLMGHVNGDVDSFVSSYLLKEILNYLEFNCEILILDDKLDNIFLKEFSNITKNNFDYVKQVTYYNNGAYIFLDHHDINYSFLSYPIIGFIDHHFDFTLSEFVNICHNSKDCMINIDSSATSFILLDMIETLSLNSLLNKENILLTYLAMLCDTDSFTSTKTKFIEKEHIENLLQIYVDNNCEYICRFKSYGYSLTDLILPISKIIENTEKVHSTELISIHSFYMHINDKNLSTLTLLNKNIDSFINDIIIYIKKNKNLYTSKHLNCYVFIIKNFSNNTTIEYDIYHHKIIKKDYNKIVSRGKDIIPRLLSEINFYYKISNEMYNNAILDLFQSLYNKHFQISTMESCTSGLIASTITDAEGASAILKGSLISYSNDAKIMFGIDKKIIDKYGVYSMKIAQEMAKKTLEIFSSDIGIGITGSFGNIDPNNKDSVQGIIYFTININNQNILNILLNLDCKKILGRYNQKIETVHTVLSYLFSLL